MPPISPLRLLVEGPDDREVVHHLLTYTGFQRGAITVDVKGGYSNLLESLRVELRASELERLGVVVDADANIQSRWDSIRDRLVDFGFQSVPRQLEPTGLMLKQPELPMVGIWVMPNNQLSGNLENFVSYLIAPEDTLWPRANTVVDDIPEAERRFNAGSISKAKVHTWLAWQEEPGQPMGAAITKRFLNPSLPDAQAFIEWLKRLFS